MYGPCDDMPLCRALGERKGCRVLVSLWETSTAAGNTPWPCKILELLAHWVLLTVSVPSEWRLIAGDLYTVHVACDENAHHQLWRNI